MPAVTQHWGASELDRDFGHKCGLLQSIQPLNQGYCEKCNTWPKPQYTWYAPAGLLPFWIRIEKTAKVAA